ncbi:lipase [Steroidobacter agaridevorans]|uniref:Lipase n=1 Tax=Steroidobacter agaridevorans TaxID=2695856 RepID=A0A829YGP9_9GAMM|nr:hypothetical protein [Steroidobacter agaridevorans]GFE82424.1 lipase [Steroidobacter agaridevorans]
MITVIRLAGFALLVSSSVAFAAYTPKGPIEQKYMANGPWAVTYTTTTVACDREGNLCDIWYPSNLGANGFRHPVISWANGSGQVPTVYSYWLRHLATWGFIVVGSRDTGTSSGGTVADAANYIIGQGNTAGSIFFGKVDGTKAGVAGHSQGGCTATKLFATGTAPFSAYYAAHPGPAWISGLLCGLSLPRDVQNTTNTGAIFYMSGAQDGGDNGADTLNRYYTPTRNTATKAFGVLSQAGHNDISGNPGCQGGGCTTGVYGYLGYPTAWFMWKLQGASDGPSAFSSSSGEFTLQTSDWITNLTNVP